MGNFRHIRERARGLRVPAMGSLTPRLGVLGGLALGLLGAGCNAGDESENLPTVQVGMTEAVAPIYDDGENQIYEVKKGVAFPILEPSGAAAADLGKTDVEPYGRQPWVTTADIDVQVSWTISNLDDEERVIEVLVDPWNEFGRYYPGLQLTNPENEEYMPNLSGIDKLYALGPKSSGEGSRLHGTYTFADMQEMATDFATVMNLIKNPPPTEDDEEDPTVTYTNHAFHWQNRSYNDLLTKPWVPKVVAGLTGIDVGFRSSEPANMAIEVAVEVVDKNGKRVRHEGEESKPLLAPTDEIITVGVAPP
jgi:hypothetical protein